MSSEIAEKKEIISEALFPTEKMVESVTILPPVTISDNAPPPFVEEEKKTGEKKGRGRPKKYNKSGPQKSIISPDEPEPQIDNAALAADRTRQESAAAITGLYIGIGLAVFGPMFGPTAQTQAAMVGSLDECFKRYGTVDVPPWVAALLVFGGHLASVAAQPEPQDRIKKWYLKFAQSWLWLKGKIHGK